MKSLKTILALSLPALALALPGPAAPTQAGRAGQEGPARQGDAGGDDEGGEAAPPARPETLSSSRLPQRAWHSCW